MFYIIYHDKSHEEVDDKTAKTIWEKSCAGMKGVEINGKKYFFSSIAKILKQDDYYQQYPDKRPPEPLVWKEPRENYEPIDKKAEKNIIHSAGLLCGLKTYIDEQVEMGITPKNAIIIYTERLKKFKLSFGVDYQHEKSNWERNVYENKAGRYTYAI